MEIDDDFAEEILSIIKEMRDDFYSSNLDTASKLSSIETELKYINIKINDVCARQSKVEEQITDLHAFKNKVYGVALAISAAISSFTMILSKIIFGSNS